jgi:hypothetical protein
LNSAKNLKSKFTEEEVHGLFLARVLPDAINGSSVDIGWLARRMWLGLTTPG